MPQDMFDQAAEEWRKQHPNGAVAPIQPSAGPAQTSPALPAPAGDMFDQAAKGWKAQQAAGLNNTATTANQQPDFVQPQGSAASRYGKGLWETTLEGLPHMAKAVGDLMAFAAGAKHTLEPDTVDMMHGVVQAHQKQAEKTKEAWQRAAGTGQWYDAMEAAGQTLGNFPMVGPAAVEAAETGSPAAPVFDKYGNVVEPGHDPDVARAMGQATGLIAPSALGLMPESVTARIPGFNRATPELRDAMKYVMEEGSPETRVPGNVGVATDNKFLKFTQKTSGVMPGGGFVEEAADALTKKNLEARAQELTERAAPGQRLTAETAGTDIAGKLESRVKAQRAAASRDYDVFHQYEADPANLKKVQVGTNDTVTGWDPVTGAPILRQIPIFEDIALPVDVSGLKKTLKPIFEKVKGGLDISQPQYAPGIQAVEAFMNGGDVISASAAEDALGAIKGLARKAGRGRGQGLAKFVIPKLQDAIDAAVAGPPTPGALSKGAQVLGHLQDARAATNASYVTERVLERIAGKAPEAREGVGTFNRLTRDRDASIGLTRRVAGQLNLSEMAKIGRAYLEELFDAKKGPDARFSEWHKLGDETKKLLFPGSGHVEELDKLMLAWKELAKNVNPSGTGLITLAAGGIGAWFTNPLTGLKLTLGSAALSKLFRSTAGVRLFTEGLRVPVGSARGLSMAARIMQLTGMKKDENEEQKPPIAQAGGGMHPVLRKQPDREAILRSLAG